MKVAKLIISHDVPIESVAFVNEGGFDPKTFTEPLDWHILNMDSSDFKTRRQASRIVNEYAVTQLPFILLFEDQRDEEGYAAVYSEDRPITIERIQEKINDNG